MKWSDATTAQNYMTQLDKIISDAAFLFSSPRNVYEILMAFNDTYCMNIEENVYYEIT